MLEVSTAAITGISTSRPIYSQTASYGHFGARAGLLSWERVDGADNLRSAAACNPPAVPAAARSGRFDLLLRCAGPVCPCALVGQGVAGAASQPGNVRPSGAGGRRATREPGAGRRSPAGGPGGHRYPLAHLTGRSTT